MFKEKIDKYKALIKKETENDNKRKIENLERNFLNLLKLSWKSLQI